MNIPSTAIKKKRGRPRKRRKQNWLPYETVKAWVQKMRFRSHKHLRMFCKGYKLPLGVPYNPRVIFKGEYEGDAIFYGEKLPRFLTYQQGKQLVKSLGITSIPQYRRYVAEFETPKIQMKLPVLPYNCKGWMPHWKGWKEFLDSNNPNPQERHAVFLPYEQAKAFVHQLKLKNLEEWKQYVKTKCPPFIPHLPERVFKDHYSLKDWLGTDALSALETRMDQPGVWAIMHNPCDPQNMLELRTFKGGKHEAEIYSKNNSKRVIRMYTYEYDLLSQVHTTIQQFSSSFSAGLFVTTNFNQLRFELDMSLLIIR